MHKVLESGLDNKCLSVNNGNPVCALAIDIMQVGCSAVEWLLKHKISLVGAPMKVIR